MKYKVSILKWLALLPLFILYNNCDGFKSVDSQKVSSSNTCPISAKVSLEIANFNPNDCSDFSAVKCEIRNFNPNVNTETFVLEECFTSEAFGKQCLHVMKRNYDTSFADGEPNDFLEGGSYNYQEINCYNKNWNHNNEAIFKSSSDRLDKAIDELYLKCARQELK